MTTTDIDRSSLNPDAPEPISGELGASILGPRNVVRIPPNLFGIALGLSGLSALWAFAGTSFGAPAAVGDALGVLSAVVWIGLTVAYLRQGPRRILADARDATVGPFLAAPVMSAYALAVVLEPHAPGAARAIVVVFLVIGLLVSGLLTGQWLTGGLQEQTFGPAFFLPGIGIGFVGADAAAAVGLHNIAELFFGIGIAAWVLISSVTLNRMFFRPRLAPGLIPTMAIELAPAAVAGNAYFLIRPGSPDLLLLGLSGYAAVMVVAQIRLLPLYRRLSFTPSFWSFTFPPANMALFALRWLELEHPAGASAYAWVLVAAITILIGAIAVRTIVAGVHGQLLPSPGRAPAMALNTG
ncbi:MAG: tellurite resistance protein [Solirubrobacteraceae bacterium]|jgi:tellurite resistance protein|nr:tellurite resistance protein [Solirubrobacteraceae bacterium]